MSQIKYEDVDKKYYVKSNKMKAKSKRIALIIVIILFLLGLGIMLSSIKKVSVIKNNESGVVDYKVYLKNNDFYSDKYLGKGMQYIASLINSINVDFTYNNRYSDTVDYEYEYEVNAKILVTDKYDSSKVLYTKDEVLVQPVKKSGRDAVFSIGENLDIDYEKYNSYVSAFKETYALDVDSNLIITMKIHYNSKYNEKQISNKESNLNISVPLTKNTIDIKIDSNKLQNNIDIPIDESFIENKIIFYLGAIVSSVSVITFIILYLFVGKKNDIYSREIKRILKNYDRLIVTSSQPNIDENNYKNKVTVTTIEELIDVNELTGEPIIYYEVEPGEKSYFIILKQDTLYKLTVTKEYFEKLQTVTQKESENNE